MFRRHLAFPVVRVSDVANQRIYLVLLQDIRPGTNRPGVHVFRRAFFQHRVGVFGGKNRGEIHPPVGQKRGVRLAEGELNVIVVDLFHVLNQLIEPDVVKVFVVALRHVVIRVFRVFLTQNRENNVIGVKVARRFEVFIAVELHPFAQGKGIGLAVRRNRPGLRQRRDRGVFHRVKIDQAVVQYLRAGHKRRARAGDLRVEGLGGRFRTVNKGVVVCRPCGTGR